MAHVEEDFCKNYLLLKAEEASCFDCARILHSNDLEKRDFFNTGIINEGGVIGFRHRWIIFISVVLQKVFLYLKKPMAAVGAAFELWLNYPPFNGGYGHLFFNFFTGRLVKPDKRSTTFTSVVGNLDKRWDLNERRRSRYNAASIAIMASKLSYENQPFARNVVTYHWQMEFIGFYNFWNDYQELDSTYAIMFRDKTVNPNRIVIAFRGTEPFNADAWRTDIDISWYEFDGIGKIHGGFMKALGLQKSTGWPKKISPDSKSFAYYTLREMLKTLIHESGDAKFILTGHSLGGALAILFAAILTIHEEEFLLTRLEGVYTFGQPRVGNEQFGEYMKGRMESYDIKYFRYVYCNDMVPRLPYDDKTFLFKHFGACLYFNSCYKGHVLEEEPNKNYFSLMYVLPKILNAVYEFIRALILPWIKGEEYREGWLMKLFRITAFIIPGLTDHFPLDYDNLTRLDDLALSVYLKGPIQTLSN
ncbi:alpha/beta-Hydrolases superfamily protein [Perilla frutescens var. hirtella]|uniref:Alpha/beta-Hydrolases superfamily protein n=1 Tax=Perilla frutescens var. hirtella TaxID=608512 RepID=A0AAD4IWN7_PERFH|nr:alpha/beta-Hydrolases superfamily protein [Perilla frutescens var. hirtella]